MAVFLTESLPKYDKSDLPGTVRRLYAFTNALTEQLRFLMMNLDEDNVPALSGLDHRLTDAEGNLSAVTQSAAGLLTRVENAEGDLSALSQTAEGLTVRVENAEGGLSTLTQTAEGLSTRVSSAEGSLSVLSQTAAGLQSRVSSAEGSISVLTQTASGLTSEVAGLDGRYTRLEQRVDGIDVTGMVTFHALETAGESTINGSNIQTGNLNIADDGVGGVYFYDGESTSPTDRVGSIEVYSTRYPDLYLTTYNGNNIRIFSSGQIEMTCATDGHIYLEGDYIQLRAGGRSYYFRSDGIYAGDQLIVPAG